MKTILLDASDDEDIWTAARLLEGGGIVAFPTETVYGLGARADDSDAVARLFRLKRRPREKRFAVLIADPRHAARYVAPLSETARKLADRFWPGPLTMVLPDGRGGEKGIRCPDCAVTQELLGRAGVPVAAPSANISGGQPAATAQQVLSVFDHMIEAVLDGGPVRLGVASTVVRIGEGEAEILREGAISQQEILAAVR